MFAYYGPMAKGYATASMPAQTGPRCKLTPKDGMICVHVQAETLYEAFGEAYVRFAENGVRATKLQISRTNYYVVHDDVFFAWLEAPSPDAKVEARKARLRAKIAEVRKNAAE